MSLVHTGVSTIRLKEAMLEEYGHRAELAAERYLNYLLAKLKNAADWESLNRLAGPFLGPESFYAGALLGIAESLTGDVVNLLGMGKMLILAGIYDRIHSNVPLALTAMDPITLALSLAAKYNPSLAAEAKAAHEQMQEIWKELRQIVAHPIVFVETVGRHIYKESVEDWKLLSKYTLDNTVTSQFKAGRITGHVLYQVVMTVLLVLSVGGAVAKIAAKFPALLRWARVIKGGGSLEELQALRRLEQGGGAAKGLAGAGEDAKAAKPVANPKPEPEPVKKTPAEQVKANAEQGEAFHNKGVDYVKQSQNNVKEEVSIRPYTENGELADYRVRLDTLGTDSNETIRLTDFKSSDSASFTPNQRAGYPLLEKYGGQIVGNNGGSAYPAGTEIPPSVVDIIRPDGSGGMISTPFGH